MPKRETCIACTAVQVVIARLRYEYNPRTFVIDKCRMTEFYGCYIVNFVKQLGSTSPDRDYFLWGDLKSLAAHVSEAAANVCVKYLASLNLYTNCSANADKHVSLLLDAILNSFCNHYTCTGGFQ